jgi:hypothetical protein
LNQTFLGPAPPPDRLRLQNSKDAKSFPPPRKAAAATCPRFTGGILGSRASIAMIAPMASNPAPRRVPAHQQIPVLARLKSLRARLTIFHVGVVE